MGKDALRLSTVLAATPQVIFRAWLDSTQHASFTNALAKIDGNIGGKFTLRDGMVTGRTMALEFGRRLLQSWRNTDFPKGAPDSRLEVLFESVGAGTRITVMHADLPEGMGEPLRAFWTDAYFGPMTDYFGRFATLLANTPPSQAVIFVEDDDDEPEPAKPKKVKVDKAKPEAAPAKAPTLAVAKDEKPKKGKAGSDEKPKSVAPPPLALPRAEPEKPKKGKPQPPEKAAKPVKAAKAEAKPEKPKAKAKPEKPKAKAKPEKPKAKAKSEKPKAKAKPEKPKAKAGKAKPAKAKPKAKAKPAKNEKAKPAKAKAKAKKGKR